MAGSLKTAFFNLAKYAANDITSWLTDFNGNMDKIDTAMNQNKTAAKTAQDGVDNLEAEYKTVVQALAQHTTAINTNEEAIAENSASIGKIENELNNITVTDLGGTSTVTIVETLVQSMRVMGRNIGNNFIGNIVGVINNGTMHVYDRQGSGLLEGYYITDLVRITGNVFSLVPAMWTPIECIFVSSGNTEILRTGICYLPESGYTVVGLAQKTATAYSVSENGTVFGTP